MPAHARGGGAASRTVTCDASPALVTEAGNRVEPLEFHAGLFIDKTITAYGPSGTGKTVLIKNVMRVTQGHIEQIIVVAPTAVSNRAYDGFVDPSLIHYNLRLPPDPTAPARKKVETDTEAAVRFLETIWQRQEMMAAIYTRANTPKTLARLYGRLSARARAEGDDRIRALEVRRRQVCDDVTHQYGSDPGRCDEKKKDVNGKFTKMLVLLYKQFIAPCFEELWRREDLTEDETYSLNYLHFNPRILLIFDDCAAQLKPIFGKEIFRKFYYQNRHIFATVFLACQDDTDLPTNLRKNNFISLFTEPVVAISNFERASNKFPKTTQRLAADIAPEVFVGNRKLAYIREDEKRQHFYHVTVPYPRPQLFGSPSLHELCDQVRVDKVTMDSANPFYDRFRIGDDDSRAGGAAAKRPVR
jgi:hypothetical protein